MKGLSVDTLHILAGTMTSLAKIKNSYSSLKDQLRYTVIHYAFPGVTHPARYDTPPSALPHGPTLVICQHLPPSVEIATAVLDSTLCSSP